MTKAQQTAATDEVYSGKMQGSRGTVNLRIEHGTRQIIDDAAASLGKTRTEFMIESARHAAIDVLLDRRLFQVSDDHFDEFADAMDNPAEPGPKLKALLDRKPAWQT